MIVCHCNVLSDADILRAARHDHAGHKLAAVKAMHCLGCKPDCGRCLPAVRAVLASAHMSACAVGCASCPGESAPAANDRCGLKPLRAPPLIAAE
jgi:bacterioferritin-associated ferredoxin